VVEQRYRAVLEVLAGVTVTEVAERYGVSRQSVHAWLRRYRLTGWPGWRTAPIGRGIIRAGCRGRWRRRSVSCAEPTDGGVLAGWCSNWADAGPGLDMARHRAGAPRSDLTRPR
jgi:Homeodomain-like domain